MDFRIVETFTNSLRRLTGAEQKAVKPLSWRIIAARRCQDVARGIDRLARLADRSSPRWPQSASPLGHGTVAGPVASTRWKVCKLNLKPALSPGVRNWSSCPVTVIRRLPRLGDLV